EPGARCWQQSTNLRSPSCLLLALAWLGILVGLSAEALTVPSGILPSALAFGQLLDRRLKALLGILARGYVKLLAVIVSAPHTVFVDPTVLDFANASCCHDVVS